MAPAVVPFHQRLDPLGVHAGAHVLLPGLVGLEGDVVHPHRQPVALGDLGAPVLLLADVVDVEEGDAGAVAEVVERVAEEAAVVERVDLGVDELEAHQVLVEVVRRLEVAARVGHVVHASRAGGGR